MNYWDLLPPDIIGKIVFDNLWEEAKENYYKKQENEFQEFLIEAFGNYTDRLFKYKELFKKNKIKNMYQLKQLSKRELLDMGVKVGSYYTIQINLE